MAKAFFTLLLLSLYLFSQSAESRNLLSTNPNDGCDGSLLQPFSCYFQPSPPNPPVTQTPPPSPTKDNCDGSFLQPIPCYFRPSPPSTRTPPSPPKEEKDPKCKKALDFIADCQTIAFHPQRKNDCCQQADDYLQCFDDDFVGDINKQALRGIKKNTCSSSSPNTPPTPPSNQKPAPTSPPKEGKDLKCKKALDFIADCQTIAFHPQRKNDCCQQADDYLQCFDDDFVGDINKQALRGIKINTCSSSSPNTPPSPPSNQEPAPSTPPKEKKDPKCKNAIFFIADCELIGLHPQKKNECCQQADEYAQCFANDLVGSFNKQLLGDIKKSTCS